MEQEREYPYDMVTGYEFPVITLFHGEEYIDEQIGFGFSLNPVKLVKSVAHFTSNAVKSAGREIGHASHSVQNAVGQIGKGIGKIPIVGGPLRTVFDVPFHLAMAPVNLATDIVIEGKRIDKAVLNNLKGQLREFKQVAPYAQMVFSVVPGVGTGVSACLAAGLALAEGQSIDEVLKAGAIAAIPGGPLVKAAVTMGVETIQRVAKGERIDLQSLGQTASGIASSALGLPIAAKNALVAGVAVMGTIASGKPIDKILADNAIKALPISDSAKKAMTEASAISLDLGHGKRLDTAMIGRINAVTSALPATHPLHDSIKTGLTLTRKAGQGKAEQTMATALQSGLGDALVSMGAQTLPSDVQKGIKAGVGLGSGSVFQGKRKQSLAKVSGKLAESGIQLAKTSPVFTEARKLAATKGSSKGFDLGSGLLQQQVGTFDVATVRDSLPAAQKLGFDMALATRIGVVANPKPPTLSPAAHAGHAIALGMQSYVPERKAALMQTIQANPSAAVGATVAVKEVAAVRANWFTKLLKALGLSK